MGRYSRNRSTASRPLEASPISSYILFAPDQRSDAVTKERMIVPLPILVSRLSLSFKYPGPGSRGDVRKRGALQAQFDLRTGTGAAPNGQVRADLSGASRIPGRP